MPAGEGCLCLQRDAYSHILPPCTSCLVCQPPCTCGVPLLQFAAWAAAVLALLSTLYLGGLYLYTGDVAAPLVACAAANAVALLGVKGSRAG